MVGSALRLHLQERRSSKGQKGDRCSPRTTHDLWKSSELIPKPHRLNVTHQALFASNRDIFDGARVLDLASHDGRYSFAALKTGAAHVTGVEVRQGRIHKAQETFAFYGQDPATYTFVCGDVFEVLAREEFDVDVVLCLGYLYHTYRHTELMYRLHNLAPKDLIVDTMVTPGTRPTLRVIREPRRRGHPQCRPGCLFGGSGIGVAALGARAADAGARLRVRDRVHVRLEDQAGRATGQAWSRRLREGEAPHPAMPLPYSGCRGRMGAGSFRPGRRGPTTPNAWAPTDPDPVSAPRAAGRWVARAGQRDVGQGHGLRAAASVHQALTTRPKPGGLSRRLGRWRPILTKSGSTNVAAVLNWSSKPGVD